MCHQLSNAQEHAMETMHRLSTEYALLKDREKRKNVVEEMDKLELEFSEANEKPQEYLDARKDELSSLATEASENTRRCRITESVAKKSGEQIRRDETKHKEKVDDYRVITGIKSSLQRDIRLLRSKIYKRTVRRANAWSGYVESTKESFHSRF